MKSEDLDRFFKDRKASGECPICKQSNWNVANGPDGRTQWSLSSVRDDGSAYMPAPSIPLLVLICANCFTVRTHAYVAVKNWLEQNPNVGATK